MVLLLAGCASQGPQKTQEQIQAERYHLSQDKALHTVDVSKIPDAVPRAPEQAIKANPYTLHGISYKPRQTAKGYSEIGKASWYGAKFHGYKTANGEIYDMYAMSAAHKTLPLPSYARVTNLDTGHSVIVRVNDRGPFHDDRLIDLSWAAAKRLGYQSKGLARVIVDGIDTSPEGLLVFQRSLQESEEAIQKTGKQKPLVTGTDADGLVYIQVAAVSNPSRAFSLKERLIDVLDSPVKVVPGSENKVYRVRIGPLSTDQEVADIQNSLERNQFERGYKVFE